MPTELHEAFSKFPSLMLLIRGETGTGKTTLVLELLSKLKSKGRRVCYISSRVSYSVLLAQFPWVKSVLDESSIVDASKVISQPKTSPSFRFMEEPAFLQAAYDFAKSHKEAAIAVDSLEAIKSTIKATSSFERALREIAEETGCHLIVVSEEMSPQPLDYIADCVVTLVSRVEHGRLIRELYINKVRGVRIRQPAYTFTLHDSRFTCFKPLEISLPDSAEKHRPQPDSYSMFSTGCRDLDTILGGGYPRAGAVLIEADGNVPYPAIAMATGVTMENFIAHGRSVISTPVAGYTTQRLKSKLKLLVGEQPVERYLRMFEVRGLQEPCKEYALTGDLERDIRDFGSSVVKAYQKTSQPPLAVIDLQVLAALYHEAGLSRFIRTMTAVCRELEALIVFATKPGIHVNQMLRNICDIHMSLRFIDRSLFLYGCKPETGYYNVHLDTSVPHPTMRLTPVE